MFNRFRELYLVGTDVFDDKDKLRKWLRSDLVCFGGKSGIYMIESGEIDEVISVLNRIKYGCIS